MIDETLTCRPGRPKDCAKREEIVAAATQLFMENGFELTSMDAVARQAGVSKLTIYSHFSDKKELFRAIVQYRCDKMGMPVTMMQLADLPAKEALLTICRSAMAKIMRPDSIRLMRVIQAEALHRPEIVQIYHEVGPRRIKAAFTELLQEFDRKGELIVPDATLAAEQFFSVLKGEKLQRVVMGLAPLPDQETIEAHIKATVDFFLAAYGPQKN